ncbi:MAG: succinylglutamate desuccinylase/aspartoacylase family protein [Pseudobdellovibrionaceae bacterium]|nr:succinylglutamate desuccinylase/aspartoacylase family protein [Pseudobdellovibrionaceae bacterium]
MRAIFSLFIQIMVLASGFVPTAYALQFQRYHAQDEIGQYLRSRAQNYPDVARFVVLGQSLQGREIAYVAISKNWSPDVPAIYFNGTHHGNEKASTEAVLALIDFLINERDRTDVDRLLRKYRIVLQPMVNPDGHAANLRTDSQGIDPNRDYATPTRPESEAFRLVETRLVRRLLSNERIVASAAFHSGLEAVLWPWCHTPSQSQHDPVFKAIGQSVARTMGMPKYTQSFHDYQTDGEFIDFAYMKFGVYALTLEVAHEAMPHADQLPAVVQRAVNGSMAFLKALDRVLPLAPVQQVSNANTVKVPTPVL